MPAPEEQHTPDLDQPCPSRSACQRENLSTRVDAETARKLRAESIRRGVPVGQILDDLVAKGLLSVLCESSVFGAN